MEFNRKKILKNFTVWRLSRPKKLFVILASIVIGILGGLAAVGLSKFMALIKEFVSWAFKTGGGPGIYYLLLPGLGIFITYLIKKYVIGESVKPGIATVLNSISKNKSAMHRRTTYSYFLTAPFTVGFGGSVGLEAPVIGAAIGSNIARELHLGRQMHTLFLGCATAAALSAIFKTPITGIIFVIELFSIELSIASLIPLMLSSVCGLFAAYILTGQQNTFGFIATELTGINHLPFVIVLAVLAAYFSVHFTRIHVFSTAKFNNINSPLLKVFIGAAMLGGLIFFMPPLYGEGYTSIGELLKGQNEIFTSSIPWIGPKLQSGVLLSLVLLAMLYLKSIATTVTFGSGGIGGFFAPSLFLGAVFGYSYAIFINSVYPEAGLSLSNFTMIGMTAVFAGIIQTPFSAVFFISELTGGYGLIMPLMFASAISFFITRKYIKHSVYTVSLVREGSLITHDKDKSAIRLIEANKLIETDFVCLSPEMDLRQIIEKGIKISGRNIFPVVDKKRGLLGVLYLDSIRKLMFNSHYHKTLYAKDIMKRPLELIIKGKDSGEAILDKFRRSDVWNLPVIDEKGHYEGFISKSRLLDRYRKSLKELDMENFLDN